LKKVQPVVKTVQRVSVVREEPKYVGTTTIKPPTPSSTNLTQSQSKNQAAQPKV